MTRFGLLIIAALGFITIGRTQFLNGPNWIFRLHTTKQKLLQNSYLIQQQGTTLQSAIAQLTTDVAGLTTDVADLKTAVSAIVAQSASQASLPQPKCPVFTREINSKCYFLSRPTSSITTAKTNCAELNGILAEPGPDDAEIRTFVDALNDVYASDIANLEGRGFMSYWISGAETGAEGDFVYAFSESSVASDDTRILEADSAKVEHLALYLTGDNEFNFIASDPILNRPFICEFAKS